MKRPRLIVEVTMEMSLTPEILDRIARTHGQKPAIETAMASSVGGIGPLLRERVISQAEEIEVIGTSLLYDKVWAQGWYAWGQLYWSKKNVSRYWRDALEDAGITLSVPLFDGTTAEVKVWKAFFGKGLVYFLDHPAINETIYPGPEDAPTKVTERDSWSATLRLKQGWILGRGTLALLKHLGKKPDLIIQSETPTFFAHHRLVQDAFQTDPFFDGTEYVFNDHTPLEYAHPIWPRDTLTQIKLDPRYVQNHPAWLPERQGLDVTCLLVSLNEGVYGVARKHAEVMKKMATLAPFSDKIDAVTNGVSPALWQSDDMAGAEALDDDALLALKDSKRQEMIDWLWRRYKLWHTWQTKIEDKPVVQWTRRVTSYKRLDVVGQIIQSSALKTRFLATNVVLLIGGRIHQSDRPSQELIFRLLDLVGHDPVLEERVVFIDNFNVWEARRLYQGSDAAVMLSDEGREASATGFMKAQMNGAIVICNNDGAIPESVVFNGREVDGQVANGFEVGYSQGKPTPEGFLAALEAFSAAWRSKTERARMIRSALSERTQVGIGRATKDLFSFYDKVLSRSDAKRNARESGRKKGLEWGSEAARLKALSASGTFSWRYKKDNTQTVGVYEHPRTLPALLDGFRWVETLGTVGEWILLFHAGARDASLWNEIRQILGSDPGLKGTGIEKALQEIAERSQTAGDKLYKVEMILDQYEMMGILEGALTTAETAQNR